MAGTSSLTLHDFTGEVLAANSSLGRLCSSAVQRRMLRQEQLPDMFIDPLSPLPLADAAAPSPSVRYVYLILASRPYAHETINRNVHALQRPGVLEPGARGTNESNLFLLHLDAKMKKESAAALRSAVSSRPDVYFLRRRRHVMWAGWSMMLPLLDVMSSLLQRRLRFEYLIVLGDADLTMRVHSEIQAFFGRFPGRSIMSIVPRKRDPRRYTTHAAFRNFCWVECDEGSGFVVSKPDGSLPTAEAVIGKRKCCWSRSAPILYAALGLQCRNQQAPSVFHGSQWASMHRSMVRHLVEHPTARRIIMAMENTLLPDEALLQTIAVNSPFRSSIIPAHLRFIEWPQLHGDANKYWATVGPQFHGGPMVLNATLAHKAFRSPVMFARKFDPSLYPEALVAWDRWMAAKMMSQAPATGQPPIAHNLLQADPDLLHGIPPPTEHEDDAPLPAEPDQDQADLWRWRALGRRNEMASAWVTVGALAFGIAGLVGCCYRFGCRSGRSFGKQTLHSTKLV